MENNTEDKTMNFRTILFLVLFSLFVLSSSAIQGNQNSSKLHAQTELVTGVSSNQHSAVLLSVVSLPDFSKFCECTPPNTDLLPFSIRNKISGYNRKIAQNLIQIQKIMLTIQPVLTGRLFFHLPSDEDDILPVLS
jgi:hypothetical protein